MPGTVKTRLIAGIGRDRATALYERLVLHTVRRVTESRLCPVELWCAPDTGHDLFRTCMLDFGTDLHVQVGDNLGERMLHALSASIVRENPVVLLGCDCPSLTPIDIRNAFRILHGAHDAVIGPALDGGYYLLGLHEAAEALFRGIPWGTDAVCEETCQRLSGLGRTIYQLGARRDLDTLEDYRAIRQSGEHDWLFEEASQGRMETGLWRSG